MVEITADVYAWLTSINMFELDRDNINDNINSNSQISNFTINEIGNVILEEKFRMRILSGVFFIKIFEKLNSLLNTLFGNIYKMDDRISNIIDDNNAKIKLKNFEIIIDLVKNYYGIVLDNDYKSLLTAGDNTTFMDFFTQLLNFYIELEDKLNKNKKTERADKQEENNKTSLKTSKNLKGSIPFRSLRMSALNNEDIDNNEESNIINIPKIRFREDFVDIEELENSNATSKPLTQTRSVLEFIIIAICRTFNMSAKQSAALLADNKKYLTHIIIKGLAKRNFKPVKQFYQEVLSHLDYFVELIQINSIAYPNQISKNIEMSLSSFKPGLLSKDIDVVYISGRVLTKLAFEFIDRNLISSAWDWFVMPGGGLEASILCLKKHDSAVEVVVSLLTNFGRYHLFELFSIYLRNYLPNEGSYFNFLSDILEKLSGLKFFTDEFIKNKIKSFFLEIIQEGSNSFNINTKIGCVGFLSELWVNFSFYIEDEEENFTILNTLKKFTRDNNRLVQYAAIAQLFRIIAIFAKERNFFAPTIYKTLTFNLVEHHADLKIKELIIHNFKNIFCLIMSIPVGILVEPYIKQINVSLGTSYLFNMVDINFLITLTRHPRLNVKDAIVILDVLGKIYFEKSGIYFYSIVRSVFTMVLSRYLITEVGVEFCFKYIKILIETFCKLDKHLSDKIYINSLAENMNPAENMNEIVLLSKPENEFGNINFKELTKSAIIEMIIDILNINNSFNNSIIKSLLISADLRHFKVFGFHNIGLSKTLEFFGNSNEIVHYYNINEDELDVDKDFEIVIELIYDRPPFVPLASKSKWTETQDNFSDDKNIKNKKSNNNHQYNSAGGSQLNRIKFKREEIEMMKILRDESYLKDKKQKSIKKKHKLIEEYNLKNKQSLISSTLNNYEILDLSLEEDRDLISLKKVIKDYQRFFKFIFNKYCGSLYHPIHGKIFDSVKVVTETIAPSEVVKMFREHDISSNANHKTYFIYKDEIMLIIGNMNVRIFKKPNSKSGLNLDEFIEIFIQIAYRCFNRPPFVYSKFTVSDFTLEMIKLFSKHNTNIVEFSHPDDWITPAEKEICSDLNKKLLKDNSVQIPQNLKKFLDTDIKHSYHVPDIMRSVLPQSQITCLEIFDEIIHKILKVHFLESFVYVKEVYKVRPAFIPLKIPSQHLEGKMKLPVTKDAEENAPRFKDVLRNVKRKSSIRVDKGIQLGLKIKGKGREKEKGNKKYVSNLNDLSENKQLLKDLSKSMISLDSIQEEDNMEIENENEIKIENEHTENKLFSNNKEFNPISSSPEAYNNSSTSKNRNPTNKYFNQIKVEKILEEESRSIIDKDKNKKRKLRVQYIKQELEKMKEQKKDKDNKREDFLNEEKRKKEEKIKEKMQVEMKLREKIKTGLLKIKRMKIDEANTKLDEEKQNKIDLAKRKAQMNDVFYNEQISKLKDEFRKMTDDRQIEEAKKRLERKFNEKKLDDEKRKFNNFFKKEKKALETEKKMFQQVDNLINKEEIKEVFKKFEDHVKLLNEIYTTTTARNGIKNNLTSNSTGKGVHIDEFQLFCVHFNITNLLVDGNEINYIFKKLSNKFNTLGYLNLESFNLALIYISLFGLKKFKSVNEDNNKNNDSSFNSTINNKTLTKINHLNKINEENIKAVDRSVMNMFFDFLGFQTPYNRREIENYINLQKNITVKEKSKLIKEKSANFINQNEISKIKSRRGSSGAISENSD